MVSVVYRIQDNEGRGPYRPGMSAKWADKDTGHYKGEFTNLPPFTDEFGVGILDEISSLFAKNGGSFGCGFNSLEQMNNWFSKAEQRRMKDLGHNLVKLVPTRIIRTSDKQTVFWCKDSLSKIAEIIECPT